MTTPRTRLTRPALALAALLLAAAPAFAADQPPTLTANGAASVSAVPDMAIVTLGVVSEAKSARAALDSNNADMSAVINTVTDAGIADKDVATSQFAIAPVYAPPPKDGSDAPAKIIGYRVSNEVRVTIRDLAASGAVLDKVVSAGANRVTGISFDIAERDALEKQALAAAIKDARAKAALMADAAGVTLARIVSINAGSNGLPRPRAMATFAAKSVPVMPGETEISANATIVWEIAGK
jgi:hypothetical protein